jgi:uncharacterized protein
MILAAAVASFSQSGQWDRNTSPLPPPTGHVNDYAGVFDSASKRALEQKLRDFKEKTGVEIAVAVVRTTGDRDIFDYSFAVARGWKIGSKLDDNPAALLFIAIDDRKYFTQISRDLEDELPDGLAGSLQRQYLVPEFRKGNYSKGISDTIDAYIRTIDARLSGESLPAATTTGEDTESAFDAFCCFVVILVIILLAYSNFRPTGRSKRDQDRWGGDDDSGGGGLGVLPWIILGGSGGSSWSDSSSSSWSDWSSGGSDWGGFGGGGDFGGGGAGGSW